MATEKNPTFLNTIATPAVQFLNADGTATKTVLLAGADGGAVTDLTATTDDTSAVIIVLSLNDGVTTNILGEITVLAGSGTDGATLPTNLLDPAIITFLQNDGSILLGPAATLLANAKVAVTATKTVYVTAMGGSYSA